MKIEHKAGFLQLASELSPENLTCDGELGRRQIASRLKDIKSRWTALEKEAGQKVTEDEAWGWISEVDRWEQAERARKLLALPQDPRVVASSVGVWSHKAKDSDNSVYYIQGPQMYDHPMYKGTPRAKKYTAFSSLAYEMGKPEELGQFNTLTAAVDAAEAFVKSVTRNHIVEYARAKGYEPNGYWMRRMSAMIA